MKAAGQHALQHALQRARRIVYRVRQFITALLAAWLPLSEDELVAARSRLPDAAWPLFLGMGRADQRHSLRILKLIEERGQCAAPLAEAALLHDCAKGPAGVRLWHRVAGVLMENLWPTSYAAWRQGPAPEGPGWRYGLWAHLHHAELGARLAEGAGCSPEAIALIRHHQEPEQDLDGAPHVAEWLAALRAADDDN